MDSFWIAFIAALIYIPLLLLWLFAMVDILDRKDLSGWGKAGWIAGIIVVPLLGTLAYLVARPAARQDMEWMQAAADTRAAYVQSAAAELDKLAALCDRGAISPDEFARLKLRVVGVA